MLGQLRFPLLFLLFYLALQWGYQAAPDWFIKDLIVETVTVKPSERLIDALWPDLGVTAQGTRLTSAQGSVNVLRGCGGTETLMLLFAAVLAAGRHWRTVLAGLLIGTALIFAVNQIRIVALFWLVVHHPYTFGMAHGYIAPLFVVGLATGFFLLWIRCAQRIGHAG